MTKGEAMAHAQVGAEASGEPYIVHQLRSGEWLFAPASWANGMASAGFGVHVATAVDPSPDAVASASARMAAAETPVHALDSDA